MCGIFGYIGKKDPLIACLNGLKLLEYRGYDSSGIAGIQNGQLVVYKEVGKISLLEEKISLKQLQFDLAIGHTRWATHGKPKIENAHPHCDEKSQIAIVHNGIIENYDTLRNMLKKKGSAFLSETDSEVIAQLLATEYRGDLLSTVAQTLKQLKGSFAIALIHKEHPHTIIAATRESPLAIAYDDAHSETLISSDPNAFLGRNLNVFYLKNDEIAVVRQDSVQTFDLQQKILHKKTEKIQGETISFSKTGFEHFMLKEIFEQPFTMQKAFLNHFSEDLSTALFPDLSFSTEEFLRIRHVLLIACGTSWHAGCIGASLIEEMAHIPATSEIASEFRFKPPLPLSDTLVIAISQSGETADTIAAVREVKARGAKVLGICNVKNSTLTREVDSTLFLHAGPEFSVCSTKAFTSQLTLLSLLALLLARLRQMNKDEGISFINELKTIPQKIEQILLQADQLQKLAKTYSVFEDFFFLGRRIMYFTCLEAALKLKEISYLNANGYPAGELKHGPIALLHPSFPVIAFCAHKSTYEKMLNNLMEVKARSAPILAFAPQGSERLEGIADHIFHLPDTLDILAPFLSSVAGQLFAYYIAKERGTEIDKPRNLAKSVTVE